MTAVISPFPPAPVPSCVSVRSVHHQSPDGTRAEAACWGALGQGCRGKGKEQKETGFNTVREKNLGQQFGGELKDQTINLLNRD